jgi:hypothetical protein
MHAELRSAQSVAIHWGTWPLADEPYHAPCQELKAALDEKGLSFDKDFVCLRHGETLRLGESTEATKHFDRLLSKSKK